MTFKIALNQNTCKNKTLVDFIEYSKNFNGVELKFESIQQHLSINNHLKNIRELLEVYATELTSIFCLKDFSLSSEHDYKTKIIPIFNQMMNVCYKLEGNLIILNPSFFDSTQNSETIPQWRILNRTIKRLQDISKKAENNDIDIGFEFVNMPNSSIKTLSDAKEVLKPFVDQENLGYIIDLFYFIKSNSEFDQLNDIKDSIILIQISDLKYESSSEVFELNESDRLFPGEGNFNFKKLFNFAQKIGYKKSYSIELLKNECSENLFKKFFKTFQNVKL